MERGGRVFLTRPGGWALGEDPCSPLTGTPTPRYHRGSAVEMVGINLGISLGNRDSVIFCRRLCPDHPILGKERIHHKSLS